MTAAEFLSRREHFERAASTNDVVRGWLAEGTAEVCLADADEQAAGRGRQGRTWLAPPGTSLLLSLGFRPSYLEPDRLWRLAAIVALAMADAAEEVAGLREGTIRLKWPNDLAVDAPGGEVRKLAGVLGETEGLGTETVRAIVGIGLNCDWHRDAFPADIATSMTSLSEISGGRPIDREALLEAFLLRLEPRWAALRAGRFDVGGWHERQLTTGRIVCLQLPDGRIERTRAVGVDGSTGGLLVEDATVGAGEREVLTADVIHVRLAPVNGTATPGEPDTTGRPDGDCVPTENSGTAAAGSDPHVPAAAAGDTLAASPSRRAPAVTR